VNHFYGKDAASRHPGEPDPEFERAWLHHQRRNKHHWQYWVSVNKKGQQVTYPMPIKYLDEMVCDWNGAALAKGQGGEYTETWYMRYKDTMVLAGITRMEVERSVFGYVVSEDIIRAVEEAMKEVLGTEDGS